MNILTILSTLQKEYPDFEWSIPPNLSMGILTTNYAFIQAKLEKSNPNNLAKNLAKEIEQFCISKDLPVTVTTVGPYVNLDLLEKFYDGIETDQNLKIEKIDKKILIDYCSINVAKPLHAGHIRNIDIGESLRRILQLKYSTVKTENYWGDWGVQFGIMLWAWKIFLIEKELEVVANEKQETIKLEDFKSSPIETLVKIYIWGNQQKDSVENWDILVRKEFLKLEQGDEENRTLWKTFLDSTKEQIYPYLLELGVKRHDYEFGESYYEQRMKDLTVFFEENNLWEKEGKARYFDFEKLVENWAELDSKLVPKIKRLGRCYLISSQGYTSYAYRDIAARIHWAGELDMDLMITITANEQNHHFAQLFAICFYLSTKEVFQKRFSKKIADRFNYDHLSHISYGFLSLQEGKMSTRKGNFLTAKELMDTIYNRAKTVLSEKNSDYTQETVFKVGIAAIKWFDLNRDSALDLTLNLDHILQFEGNTGVYQLYTIARLNSILKKNLYVPEDNKIDFETLNETEKLILKKLVTLPWILENICQNYKPHLLCNYLFELSSEINSWYSKNPVYTEPNLKRKTSLLALCNMLKLHLQSNLNLLAIDSLDEL